MGGSLVGPVAKSGMIVFSYEWRGVARSGKNGYPPKNYTPI